MTAPEAREITSVCTALHCEDEHPPLNAIGTGARDALVEMLRSLIETHHATHDLRFPWSLCSRDTCRETAIALGVRP